MSDRWAEFGQTGKSPACTREEHGSCAHFVTLGGGINPRRLRLEAGAGLCPCPCHSPCPVALSGKRMTVPLKTWHESCTCPGAEDERRRLDQSGTDLRGVDERRDDARGRTLARKEAFQATQARAAGKSRDEIREIYLAESSSRGLRRPSDSVLDAIVERVSGNPFPAVRVAAESLVQMGKAIHALSRGFRSGG
jgi:hypothetical protein